MRLYTDFVVDSLCDYHVGTPADKDALPSSFSRMELYLGQDTEPDVLYVVNDKSPDEIGNVAFLVAAREASPSADGFCVVGIDAAQAVNLITRHVAAVSTCLENLRDCYYRQHDLQGFCQQLALFVGNPVVAYDDAVLPIAQSEFPAEYAHAMFGAQTISNDYVFRTIPDWFAENKPIPAPTDGFDSSGAFRVESNNQGIATATCNIAVDGVVRGFVDIFAANKAITNGEMRVLEEACHILETPYPYEDNRFIESRLEGRTTQNDLTGIWLSALRWRSDDEVFVIAVDLPPAFSNSMHNMDRAMRVLRSLIPSSVCVQMGAIPVLVVNNRLTARQKAIATIASFLKTTGTEFYLGASELLIGVGSLHEGYVHAQFAAQFAMRQAGERNTACFEECQFSFFRNLCALDENKDLLVDAAVSRMYADDQMAGTDNTLTAKTYIETGFNLNATAKAVSVHRNTVSYRLKHIADRYGIDLSTPVDDSSLVFRVLLSCKVLLGDS